jgi:hypothetical protein
MFRNRNRFIPLVVVIAAACLSGPVFVEAGLLDNWLGKDKDDVRRARYDQEPALAFDGGQLGVDAYGRWKLGGSALVFTGASRIRSGERTLQVTDLRMGQRARVTGTRAADGSLVVRRMTVTGMAGTGLGSTRRAGGDPPVGEMPPNVPK